MKQILISMCKVIAKLVWSTLLWISVAALGYGAQSLSNLIELPIVWTGTVLVMVLPERYMPFWFKVFLVTLFVLALRTFMPLIPE